MVCVDELIEEYESQLIGMGDFSGGEVRGNKGTMVESLTSKMVLLSWQQLGGCSSRIYINNKRIKIPIKEEYVNKSNTPNDIRDAYFSCSVDRHIFIDGIFVMGIECKSYTENAMIKRILVDFDLLKHKHPNIECVLVQLESNFDSSCFSSHTLRSYFPNVDLKIITLLEGKRQSKEPIHNPKFYKPLKETNVKNGINQISKLLEKFI